MGVMYSVNSPLALEDTQDLASSDACDLGNAGAITEDNTDLAGGAALPGELADLQGTQGHSKTSQSSSRQGGLQT